MNGSYLLQYEELWKVQNEEWEDGECHKTHLVDGGYNGGIFIQRKENYCSELKKNEAKNKKPVKNYNRIDKQEPSVKSATDRTRAVQVWSWRIIMSSPKPGNWPLSLQHLYLKIKKWVLC